ncbi:MAG: hypothetical protein LUQ65_07710 [Candidatus Helarchaeota archaeon]|nr:hypothetical protein [Candidatus Helarchaeota archaeon]
MMEPSSPEEEFREMQKEIADEDPVVRGLAAVDLGSFAMEHPEFKDQALILLEKCLNDPDPDTQLSAKKSIDMIQGKQIIEAETEGKQVISFGYLPEEYRQPQANTKQSMLSCVCCIILMIVITVTLFIIF